MPCFGVKCSRFVSTLALLMPSGFQLRLLAGVSVIPFLTLAPFTCIAGCGKQARSSGLSVPASPKEQQSARPPRETLGLTVNGETVSAELLAATALEAAGSVAVEEHALMIVLNRELLSAGVKVSAADIEAERTLLLQRIASEANLPVDQAASLVERFRSLRGLGPTRFAALLERTAKLRALVRSSKVISPEEVAAAVERESGLQVRARLLVVSSAQQAATLRGQLLAATPDRQGALFAQFAYEQSRDPSSSRGGLFGPVSPQDPAIPASLRNSLTLPVGNISDVLSIDSGFALLRIEESLPGQVNNADSTAKVVTRLEREAVEKLAAELMSSARIMVQDQSARWAWENRPR
jgi:parvulin-like peptidyl-prolyl isomerase